jgi:hypothetical protein
MEAFLRTLDPYLAFLNLDIDEQVAALKVKANSSGAFVVADCKQAIVKARDASGKEGISVEERRFETAGRLAGTSRFKV